MLLDGGIGVGVGACGGSGFCSDSAAPGMAGKLFFNALVGAGLGYGAGALGETLLPEKWERGKLKRTLALMGGAAGATPGLGLMAANATLGRGPTDARLVTGSYDDQPPYRPKDFSEPSPYEKASADFAKLAYLAFSDSRKEDDDDDPLAVDIDTMGRTLWDVGAKPGTVAATMGSRYAASQLPDSNAEPGMVTPHQTGLLGQMMGAAGGGAKGYAVGWMAGKALGLLTGMPTATQNMLRNTGAVLGIVDAVVPKLFH